MPSADVAFADSGLSTHLGSLSHLSLAEVRAMFDEALDRLEHCPEPASIGLRAAVELEGQLSLRLWGGFIETLVTAASTAIVDAVRSWARGHILQAPECIPSPPLGRVASLDDLSALLQVKCQLSQPVVDRALGLLLEDDGDQWRHGVRFLTDAVNPASSARWREIPLGNYLMWATFSEAERDPFANLASDQILAALGIDEVPGVLMVRFQYELDAGTPVRFPTIVEAGASAPWNRHFRPSVDGRWGETVPVSGHGVTVGRPEVVHEPVEVTRLTGPLRTVESTIY